MATTMFFIIVRDGDKNLFSVDGPTSDDTRITNSVIKAQEQGRQINCHTVSGASADAVANTYGKSNPELKRAPRGSLL